MAVDVQGASAAAPYVQKHGVTFPVAVDMADVLGGAFGLKAIPVAILVDEVGLVRLVGGGPSSGLLEQIGSVLKERVSGIRGKSPQLPAAATLADLERGGAATANDWKLHLALARAYHEVNRNADALAQLEAAAALRPRESSIPFVWGLVLLHQGQKESALVKLKQARDLDPENWRIRKQIWAIEHPDKFYTGESPDYGWQKEQLAAENKAVGR